MYEVPHIPKGVTPRNTPRSVFLTFLFLFVCAAIVYLVMTKDEDTGTVSLILPAKTTVSVKGESRKPLKQLNSSQASSIRIFQLKLPLGTNKIEITEKDGQLHKVELTVEDTKRIQSYQWLNGELIRQGK